MLWEAARCGSAKVFPSIHMTEEVLQPGTTQKKPHVRYQSRGTLQRFLCLSLSPSVKLRHRQTSARFVRYRSYFITRKNAEAVSHFMVRDIIFDTRLNSCPCYMRTRQIKHFACLIIEARLNCAQHIVEELNERDFHTRIGYHLSTNSFIISWNLKMALPSEHLQNVF